MANLTKKQLEVLIELAKPGYYLDHWFDKGRFQKERTYLRSGNKADMILETIRNDYYRKFFREELVSERKRDFKTSEVIITQTDLELLKKLGY